MLEIKRMESNTTALESEQLQFPIPKGVFAETAVSVQHYTEKLFMFRMTRPKSFRFRSGEFVMIGLPNATKPVFRAYSIACPSWDDELEFYSIKVPDGPLTKNLQKLQTGDTVLMRRKPTGTLVNDALLPGRRLFLFSTGTGIAPFASIIRDPETYEKFEIVVLTHTCRKVVELSYGFDLINKTYDDPLVGDEAKAQLIYYPTVTRDKYNNKGRITDLLQSGRIFEELGCDPLDTAIDRCMICGSMEMIMDTKKIVENLGFKEGSNREPADFVIERAFAESDGS